MCHDTDPAMTIAAQWTSHASHEEADGRQFLHHSQGRYPNFIGLTPP